MKEKTISKAEAYVNRLNQKLLELGFEPSKPVNKQGSFVYIPPNKKQKN